MLEQPWWKVGNLSNIQSIFHFVPQTVRVENTTRTSDRSKTELHLRAMLKTVLAELEKSGKPTGLDAGLLEGMHKDVDTFESLD